MKQKLLCAMPMLCIVWGGFANATDPVETIWLETMRDLQNVWQHFGCEAGMPSFQAYDVSSGRFLTVEELTAVPHLASYIVPTQRECANSISASQLGQALRVNLSDASPMVLFFFDLPGEDANFAIWPDRFIERRNAMYEAFKGFEADTRIQIRTRWTPDK